jgi:cyclic pyranopterin phosphate synthase
MTTNGVLLPRFAHALAAAGLSRLTVSLDALDDHTFRAMSDTRFGVADVLAGIEAAQRAGFTRLKINTVVRAGLNDDQVPDLIERFRGTGHVIRFIEYMDVGSTNGWSADHVVPARQILAAIEKRWPVETLPATRYGEVAQRFRLADGSAEFGLITSVTQPFCGSCNRARITADGRLHTCLFSTCGVDLLPVLRGERRPGDLAGLLASRWRSRADRYSEIRGQASRPRMPAVEMSYIGG